MKQPSDKSSREEANRRRSSRQRPPPSFGARQRIGRTHSIRPNRLGDVLDAMAAKRAVSEIELVFDLIVNCLRNAHRAGFGQRLEPGGDIDAITEDIVTVDDYIAEIDADPQFEPALARDRVVDGARGPLHL